MKGDLIMIASSKITSKGQVTLPLRIRDKAKLAIGDVINFELKEDCVIIRKPKNLMDYVGFLGDTGIPDDVEEAFTPEVVKAMLERE